MRKQNLLILFFLCLAGTVSAQGFHLSGKLVNEKDSAIDVVDVFLFNKNIVVKHTITQKDGSFFIDSILQGNYMLMIKQLDDTLYTQSISISKNIDFGTIKISSKELKDVVVKANYPIITRNVSGYDFAIENTMFSTGYSANELLPLLPGVMVDNDGNISLNMKSPILVMVDNREIKMSSDQLQLFLNTIRSDNIKSIEVIAHPSAAYDAEGVNGVIKIVTKKIINKGISGSVSEKYEQGVYPKNIVAANVLWGSSKFSAYAGISGSVSSNFSKMQDNRLDTVASTQQNILTNARSLTKSYTANAGFHYNINKNNKLNFDANYGQSTRNSLSGRSSVNTELYSAGILDTLINSTMPFNSKNNNLSLSVNYLLNTDTLGSNLQITSDYLHTKSFNYDEYDNNYYLPDNTFINNVTYDNAVNNTFGIFTFKADRHRVFSKTTSLDYGIKYSDAHTHVDNSLRNLYNNAWVPDSTYTNRLGYDESIYAGYASFTTTIKRLQIVAGLRAEYTDYKIISYTIDTADKNNYLKWFPNVSLTYSLGKKRQNSLTVAYQKGIMRPSYEIMNPFIYRTDLYTLKEGNPYLKPAITNNISATYSFKNNTYSITPEYYVVNDIFGEIEIPKGNMTLSTFANLDKKEQWQITGFATIPVIKIWTMIWQATPYYAKYTAPNYNEHNFGIQLANIDIFRFSPTFDARLTTMFLTKGADRFYIWNKNFLISSLDVNKTLGKSGFQLKAGVNDIFNARGNMSLTYNYLSLRDRQQIRRESRYAYITIIYNFKKGKSVKKETFTKSNAEEQQRVN